MAVDANHEITAMPQLLELLDCDKIARRMRWGGRRRLRRRSWPGMGTTSGGHANQPPTLHAEKPFRTPPRPGTVSRLYTTEDQATTRRQRTVRVLLARGQLLAVQYAAWLGVLTFVMSPCRGEAKGWNIPGDYCPQSRRPMPGVWHRHSWTLGVENGLHWVLAVVFREAARRVQIAGSGECGVPDRWRFPAPRGYRQSSMQVKRKAGGWSLPYLMQRLGFHST